jgi:heat shock protein HtpX
VDSKPTFTDILDETEADRAIMPAAFGLSTQIQSNQRRSIALLIGLFFLVYLITFAGALLDEALFRDVPFAELGEYEANPLGYTVHSAWRDLQSALPWASFVVGEPTKPAN